MTTALILAGGSESIGGYNFPKQFISVYDKPLIIYTLESFEHHPLIDNIEIVCLDKWQTVLEAYIKQFNITKAKWIVTGGVTVQESILNGIKHLEEKINDNDIVVIHDGIRPMVDEEVLTDVLRIAKEKGNAISATPYNEQLFIAESDNESITNEYVDRNTIMKVSTPQAFLQSKLLNLYWHYQHEDLKFTNDSYTDTMMIDLGEQLYFASGSDRNIKINTNDDIEMFKILLSEEKEKWLK